jgi:hypothetical protein
MKYVDDLGYIRVLNGKINKKNMVKRFMNVGKSIFLVKARPVNRDDYGGYINLKTLSLISFKKKYVGKRVRLRVELMEDVRE